MPATHHCFAPGAIFSAASAAAQTITPSRTTGVRRAAACTRSPASAARSAPPATRSTDRALPAYGRARRIASRIAATLSIQRWSSMPVPRPTTSTGSRSSSAPTTAAAAVVFPMPISPGTIRSVPASISSSAISRPTANARSTSAGVSASTWSIRPLARRTRYRSGAAVPSTPPGAVGTGVSTETSTTRTDAPTWRASALTAAPPAAKFATICAVTSAGKADTPVAAMPWSPAMTITRIRRGGRGGQTPWVPLTQIDRSSSRPSAPGGLVRMPWRPRAAAMAAPSRSGMSGTASGIGLGAGGPAGVMSTGPYYLINRDRPIAGGTGGC
ncbi:hypothetical protein UG55_1006295 [Frankia sp. EI5c]|nr:hypothetical protein UG55_1006295 [Frankia sp. EI5c]